MATTSDKSPIFLDTNALIRATVATAPQHQETRRALQHLWNTGVELWISCQVLREYAAVLTRPQTYTHPLDPTLVATQLRTFTRQFRVADENMSVVAHFIALLESVPIGGKQVHDANIVATMQAYGIRRLMTFNLDDFARFSALITTVSLGDINR